MKVHVGRHIGFPDICNEIQDVIDCGGDAVQFFVSDPSKLFAVGAPLADSEVQRFNEIVREHNIYVVIHGKLTPNLCRPYNHKTQWQYRCILYDLREAARFGADVVIHQGKNLAELKYKKEEALLSYITNIKNLIDQTPNLNNRIILENSCQQGTEVGFTIEELGFIWKILGKDTNSKYRDRIGFCLDLCHIYVAGTLNVSLESEVDRIFTLFDQLIGLEHLKVIHFNDSEVPFNSHNDSHCDILRGYIGNSSLGGSSQGFRRIIKICTDHQIPLILETPGVIPFSEQIKLLKNWSNDEESTYLERNKTSILEFAENPSSRKGRKKKQQPIAAKKILKKTLIIKKV